MRHFSSHVIERFTWNPLRLNLDDENLRLGALNDKKIVCSVLTQRRARSYFFSVCSVCPSIVTNAINIFGWKTFFLFSSSLSFSPFNHFVSCSYREANNNFITLAVSPSEWRIFTRWIFKELRVTSSNIGALSAFHSRDSSEFPELYLAVRSLKPQSKHAI